MRKFLLFALPILTIAADASYIQKVETWRKNYETELRAPSGWLAVAGLVWLQEGANSMGSSVDSRVVLPNGAPAHTEPLVMSGGQVTYEGKPLEIDKSTVKFGDVTITAIKRSGRVGVRLRDPNAATRMAYHGSNWYPIDPKWRVTATWIPDPKTISIVNILGMKEDQISPGRVEFTLVGKKITLEPVVEVVDGEEQLFFIFKDLTNGKQTYGAGRYLYTAMPKDGKVELEFNEAKNPPCAFTAYATCPLPPRQNAMPIALEAGEKNYGKH